MKDFLWKFTSVKNWALLFVCVLLGFIVFMQAEAFNNLAMVLATSVLGYFGFNVWQKKIVGDPKDNRDNRYGETSL